MCHRLWAVTRDLVKGKDLSSQEKYGWVKRYCIDMTTQEIFEPQEYFRVKPHNRIFVWPRDVNEAVGKLNLVPAESRTGRIGNPGHQDMLEGFVFQSFNCFQCFQIVNFSFCYTASPY